MCLVETKLKKKKEINPKAIFLSIVKLLRSFTTNRTVGTKKTILFFQFGNSKHHCQKMIALATYFGQQFQVQVIDLFPQFANN